MFKITNGNYKGRLLEIAAQHFGQHTPQYQVDDYGPDHAKVFLCSCYFQNHVTEGEGRTLKAAEQAASKAMLAKISIKLFTQQVIQQEDYFAATPYSSLPLLPPEVTTFLEDLPTDSYFDIWSLFGNAVLRSILARYLFDNHPQFAEGTLSSIISSLLETSTRAKIATGLGLTRYVRTAATTRVLAETYAALVGKVTGLHSKQLARQLVLTDYEDYIKQISATLLSDASLVTERGTESQTLTTVKGNFKGDLFEYAQRNSLPSPVFRLISQSGPAHAPQFTVTCDFDDFQARGSGATRKDAEQAAAKKILSLLNASQATSVRIIEQSHTYQAKPSTLKRFTRYELKELQSAINWPHMSTTAQLNLAFTHPSKNASDNYQRLEFLGDAILKPVLLAFIMKQYPELSDKALLSPIIDSLISAETQAKIAIQLDLEQFICTQTAATPEMLSDVLEALIAALYLDAETQAESLFKQLAATIIAWFQPEITSHITALATAAGSTDYAFSYFDLIDEPVSPTSTSSQDDALIAPADSTFNFFDLIDEPVSPASTSSQDDTLIAPADSTFSFFDLIDEPVSPTSTTSQDALSAPADSASSFSDLIDKPVSPTSTSSQDDALIAPADSASSFFDLIDEPVSSISTTSQGDALIAPTKPSFKTYADACKLALRFTGKQQRLATKLKAPAEKVDADPFPALTKRH